MVSSASVARLHATHDADGFLELLTIEVPSASPIRLVNDTRDWTIGGNVYIGLPMRIKLPSQAEGQNPLARLQMDNVGRGITAALESLPVGTTLFATLQVVGRATPTVVDYEFIAQLSSISVTPTVVSANMGLTDTLRQSAVRIRFDPVNAPGLFPG